MKKTLLIVPVLLCISALLTTACNDETSYADMREKEEKLIRNFIKNGVTIGDTVDAAFHIQVDPIEVISETKFNEQGDSTDVARNEYVYFSGTGVYMQIVRKGTGSVIKEGGRASIICRYVEYNLSTDSVRTTNRTTSAESVPDKMSVTNNYGTLSGSFTSGVMYSTYGAAVPSGWLQPLHYIRIGRQSQSNAPIALVRLIVPSTQGQSDQNNYVYPCFYEISFERDR